MRTVSRRTFLATTALAGVGTAVGAPVITTSHNASLDKQKDLEVHLFSKHLQFLDCNAMAA
ncbi:MAG: twin-arginine translocation signal domain-containing protein, partial [Bacteroidota bacterium]